MTIFADKEAAVAELRADRLLLSVSNYWPDTELGDDYLYAKLLAAEADASRQLRVFFEPTEVVPDDASQDEIDALEAQNIRYVQEPAYDYDPSFFRGERWGYIVTQHKPVLAVHSIVFAYPTPDNKIFQIPNEWIRLDRTYGHIRLVPAAMAFSAPLSAFIMQALGGGRAVPFMLRVRYRAGLKDVQTEWPDLVDTIKKMAVLRIINDLFPPQSGSISADGLSQSISMDTAKYRDNIDERLGDLRDAIHGVRVTAL